MVKQGSKVIVEGNVGFVREVDNTIKSEVLYLVVEHLDKDFAHNFGWFYESDLKVIAKPQKKAKAA